MNFLLYLDIMFVDCRFVSQKARGARRCTGRIFVRKKIEARRCRLSVVRQNDSSLLFLVRFLSRRYFIGIFVDEVFPTVVAFVEMRPVGLVEMAESGGQSVGGIEKGRHIFIGDMQNAL